MAVTQSIFTVTLPNSQFLNKSYNNNSFKPLKINTTAVKNELWNKSYENYFPVKYKPYKNNSTDSRKIYVEKLQQSNDNFNDIRNSYNYNDVIYGNITSLISYGLPFSYEILKTKSKKERDNINVFTNESKQLKDNLNIEEKETKPSLGKITSTNGKINYHNRISTEPPSNLRRLRTVDDEGKEIKITNERRQRDRSRLDKRDRHRHSKRVKVIKPVNYLLPPIGLGDRLPEQSEKKNNKQYRKLLLNRINRLSIPNNQTIVDSIDTDKTRNSYDNKTNLFYDKIGRINFNYEQPSLILKPPIITLTTKDHIFYVTPRLSQNNPMSATTPMLIKSIAQVARNNNIDSYSTIGYDNNLNTEQKYLPSTMKSNNIVDNIVYKKIRDPISVTAPGMMETTANWLPLPTSDIKTGTSSEEINTDATLIQTGNKNNYYLPNTETNSHRSSMTTSLPETVQTPMNKINFMETEQDIIATDRLKNEDINDVSNDKKFIPVPLLSPGVKMAGMKIYKLNNNKNRVDDRITIRVHNDSNIDNIYSNNDNQNVNEKYDSTQETISDGLKGEEDSIVFDEETIKMEANEGRQVNDYNNLRLAVAETAHYKRPFQYMNDNSRRHDHVIPGAPGEDYPTLSRPPPFSSHRYSCKNDGRRYIADVSTGCQVFFMCVGDGPGEAMLCPNGTLFSQDFLVCDWWYNVDCHQ